MSTWENVKKVKFLVIGSGLTCLLLVILTVIDKLQIKSLTEQNSDLTVKIDALQKQISTLESDKEELEGNVTDLSRSSIQAYHDNTYIPHYPSNGTESLVQSRGPALSSNGYAVVVYKPQSCDYFILENASGYIVAEWMGGNDPEVGEKLTGGFNSFGTREVYNQTADSESNLWIDDYMLSKDDAFEKLRDHCN